MVKIKINNKEVEVAEGTTVLKAALANKVDIPYFCYHPKLSISGNCRMCLVNIKGQNKPVISCRERVREGMEVDTKSEEVKKMQQGVLEFILVNHPLDCPICDQSGECDLQDNYFKFSKFPSRLEDQKIHKPKVKSLGPLVTLDDERCIVCTRCVRFCDEVAGTHELCVTERGGHSELTTYPGKELKNPYSLCTVDVCPVGALTSTDFRFKKRVWFLKTTPSICTGCATGCNIKMDWDDSVVYRYRPRENEAVNQCWMCDEGRLSYKFINDANRVFEPLLKKHGEFEEITWEGALKHIADICYENPKVHYIGVLSAQASCEENFTLHSFLKNVFPKAQFLTTKKEVPHPSHDEFLIDADKNPNSNFLELLEIKEADDFAKEGIYFVLEHLTNAQKEALIMAKPKMVVWLASNLGDVSLAGGTSPKLSPPLWADVILPKPTFAEQEGHFINRQKRLQKANKAFEPKGHARPVWMALAELSRKLDKPLDWNSYPNVFKEMSQELKWITQLQR
ncbi:MAG: hypothetical protein A2W61_06700 [Deltaproteobacteria bacterium RIFCSPLOWO2_01_44_7]|nr:MAG: hypothetical protein A2712_05410 [Deltaproteobacteria bacterium RIFCSPHIGHO2_01_FULL_43_49]OGQ14360.1 MAG: hypothetical protein A3D22_04975 [Deltaproteobacteria bacterium RIFCSPHIGHO2_02_FULL_44_53]OGQ27600.1 MAG: hypothetical protein A3D98_09200 [Deltaproteobacteria bacterium RIFCSPHIGHO2_12_FULL_44_21]OGQ30801.1 MAG: hypothetical protein A2979_01385 [Deltaproteobacteria bacterium RIFCSPLOWO2_01_FULL_45_74]OGQ38828.1 MAG: hypothetical protein A2W61_06700 [Deltaproteobacteria bacterium 